MTALAVIGSLASGIVGAMGAAQSANAQEAAANTRAAIAERNRRQVLAQTDNEVIDKTRENRRQLSSLRAAYGASGIDLAGSPLDVLEDSAAEQEQDVGKIKYQGELRALGYSEEAQLARMEAQSAKKAGGISVIGKLFGGISGAGSSLARA